MSTDKITVWEAEWKKGNTATFHLPEVNSKLLNNMDILLGSSEPVSDSQPMKTVLVPLCGKTKDMLHLHSLGHNVIGCEWIEQACVEFFSENNIEFTKSPLEGADGSLYTVSVNHDHSPNDMIMFSHKIFSHVSPSIAVC